MDATPGLPRPRSLALALYQPDIPQNTGAMMRLAACFGVALALIEPCGFVFDDRKLRRAGMDYRAAAAPVRHASWQRFQAAIAGRRLVLLTTRATLPYHRFAFAPDDVLLVGRESGGVPEEVHAAAAARILIPMRPGLRSLNVAMAASVVLSEALRQTGAFEDIAAFPPE